MKKLLSVLLTVFLVGVIGVQIVDAEPSVGELKLKDIKGEILQQGKETQNGSDIHLNNLQITQKDGIVKIKGDIVDNGALTPLVLHGKLYPIEAKGKYAGKLVLGDIQGNEKFNVLQFRVENNSSNTVLLRKNYPLEGQTVLTILLEHKKSDERVCFQDVIPKNFFTSLFDGANVYVNENKMTDDEIAEKVINLFNINNNSEIAKQQEKILKIEEQGTADSGGGFSVDEPISTLAWNDIPVDGAELSRLLNDLKNVGNVNLLNYDIPESLFKGNSGWKKYSSISSSPRWLYHAYSSEQNNYTITQISYVNMIARHNTAIDGFEVQYRIHHGMILEYTHNTKELEVLYYNWGLTYPDLELSHGALSGDNIYITQNVNGEFIESSNQIVKALMGLIKYGDIVTDIWDCLNQSETPNLGQTLLFESTVEDQMLAHDGKVYRIIAADFSNWTLRNENHYANLRGQINYTGGYSLTWGWKSTVQTNL
jgi:hypothetical protein